MSKKFDHIALAVRNGRVSSGLSQSELSAILGYKNGQFISNVERGLCSVPATQLLPLAKAVKMNVEVLIQSAIEDYRHHLATTAKNSF